MAEDFIAGWQLQPQSHQKFAHPFFGAGYGAHVQFGFGPATLDRDDDVHAFDGGDFADELAGAGAQPFAVHPHLKDAPQGEGQKAHNRAPEEGAR